MSRLANEQMSKFPLVGVLTVPSTIISLVGDNTNHRELLFLVFVVLLF